MVDSWTPVIDTATVNALLRIIIAEIPTMAFHKVLMYQNTSIIPEELLIQACNITNPGRRNIALLDSTRCIR